jgi:anti-sigma factor RsiW
LVIGRFGAGVAQPGVQEHVPRVLLAAVARTHVDCSRHISHLHPDDFPIEVAALPEAIRKHLGRPTTIPDLSSIGYRFDGAGPCRLAGANTVHLLYRSTSSGLTDALSLFVQQDSGQLQLPADVVHRASEAGAAHPAFFWRSAGMAYYLVGNDSGVVEVALDKVTGSPLPRA